MSKACVFCGAPGGSREHLWSAALGPEIAKRMPSNNGRSFKGLDGQGRDIFKQNGMPSYATTIPCVCHSCNNSWMNRLDERTRTKTIRLIRGQSAEYNQNDTIYLASWLAMKMIVRDEYEHTETAFSLEDKLNFYLTGLPPADMWIGIALCGQGIWASAFHRQNRKVLVSHDPAKLRRQASYTMGLGGTVAFIEFPRLDGHALDVPADQVLTIWPQPAPFSWPARRRLSSMEIRRISMRFDPSRESAGDLFGRSQMRVAGNDPTNRHERRAQNKNRSV